MTLDQFTDPDLVCKLLECRTVLDKIGIPAAIRTSDDPVRIAIEETVRAGIIRWIDRATPTYVGFKCDIYKLTPAGIAFCNELGILQH